MAVLTESLARLRRANVFRVLDAIADCVCVFDLDARLRHRNTAYHRLRLRGVEDRAVCEGARQLARVLALRWWARVPGTRWRGARAAREIGVGSRTFRMRASLVEMLGIGARPLVVVRVRETGRSRSRGAVIQRSRAFRARARFALTPREAEVAVMLARRLTNREVARQLGISVHTVRHHVETVLTKLGIRSRRQVAAKLFGPAQRGAHAVAPDTSLRNPPTA